VPSSPLFYLFIYLFYLFVVSHLNT